MKNLFIEDCFETLKRNLTYDYVLTSPPDFDELGKDTNWSYESFLESLVEKLNPKGNFISVCISDRKSKGVIVSKHCMVINTFNKMKYKLHSHKIWVKSTGIDTMRMNYQHLLTFAKNKQNRLMQTDFKPDVFVVNQSKWKSFSYAMPTRIVELLIKNYTDKGDTVYDPFMGSGTTAEACVNTGRQWLGSEINQKYSKLILDRLCTN